AVVHTYIEPGFIGICQHIPIPVYSIEGGNLHVWRGVKLLRICDTKPCSRNRDLLISLDHVRHVNRPSKGSHERHDHCIVSFQHETHIKIPGIDESGNIVTPLAPYQIITGMSNL